MNKETIHRYITLDQIEQLRDASHSLNRPTSLRDEVIIVLLSDLGLRVSELTEIKESMLHLEEKEIIIPSHIQKQYPNDKTPTTATLRLDPYGHFNTVRLIRTYLNSDWYDKNSNEYIFPSRESEKMSSRSVRNMIKKVSVEADVKPKRTDGEPSEPEELHPHSFRHSLASYMLRDEDTRLVDVRNRLRHTSITTTESIYEHLQIR